MLNDEMIIQYISNAFENVHVVNANGDSFFFYGPMSDSNKFPFATLVTKNDYDRVSDLDRAGVFRLNVGISKASYLALFGTPAPRPGADGIIDTGYEYATLDQIMPHPVYGNMYWVCVLNPGDETFEQVKPLLAEAYAAAVSGQNKRATSA